MSQKLNLDLNAAIGLAQYDTPFLRADWPAPAQVKTLLTTRKGGVSKAPFAGLNVGAHVGALWPHPHGQPRPCSCPTSTLYRRGNPSGQNWSGHLAGIHAGIHQSRCWRCKPFSVVADVLASNAPAKRRSGPVIASDGHPLEPFKMPEPQNAEPLGLYAPAWGNAPQGP